MYLNYISVTILYLRGSPPHVILLELKHIHNCFCVIFCLQMQSKTFRNPLSWNDVPCTQARSYICETKAVPGEQITTPKPTRES